MPSEYWDEKLAERLRQFRYEFPEKTLAGQTIVVAGGTGGLGSALVALLATRRRARHRWLPLESRARRSLARSDREQFGAAIDLVAGDIAEPPGDRGVRLPPCKRPASL